jgi:hypothetical protein
MSLALKNECLVPEGKPTKVKMQKIQEMAGAQV